MMTAAGLLKSGVNVSTTNDYKINILFHGGSRKIPSTGAIQFFEMDGSLDLKRRKRNGWARADEIRRPVKINAQSYKHSNYVMKHRLRISKAHKFLNFGI
jgi:hypothetical protein